MEISTEKNNLRFAVIFATRGRPKILEEVVRDIISTQTKQPDLVIVSCPTLEDAGNTKSILNVKIVISPPGLAAQRNAALALIPFSIDIIIFLDDDFLMHPNWIRDANSIFLADDNIASLTGDVIFDDIKGPGLSFSKAKKIIASYQGSYDKTIIDGYSPYGCNMAFRNTLITGIFFDERLVLYGWLEDRDFGARIRKSGGKLVKAMSLKGVHMGVKSGRVSGVKLGYSQIVNPLYLKNKNSMSTSQVVDHIFRNMTSNIIRSFYPEKYIDRRGRLRGNIMGVFDILKGVAAPERAEKI